VAMLSLLTCAASGAVGSPSHGASDAVLLPADAPSCCSRLRFFVINIEHRADRLHAFGSALPQCARDAGTCRVAGIEGKLLGEQLPTSLIAASTWDHARAKTAAGIPSVGSNDLTVGSVGLTVAHALAWRQMVEENIEMAIVAEDDTVFYAPSFASEVEKLCAANGTWDFLQLQNDDKSWSKTSADLYGVDARAAQDTSLLMGQTAYNLGFYALTNRGARQALGLSFPMARQLDAECGPLRAGIPSSRVGMFVPPLAQCSTKDSDAQVRPTNLELDTTDSQIPDCAGMSAFSGSKGAAAAVSAVLDAHQVKGEGSAPVQSC